MLSDRKCKSEFTRSAASIASCNYGVVDFATAVCLRALAQTSAVAITTRHMLVISPSLGL